MPLLPLKFKPGVVREVPDYSYQGGWYDCDKIRFRGGLPEVIGGWDRYSQDTFSGTIRALYNWATLTNDVYLAVGTTTHFYVEVDNVFYDMTPVIVDTTAANPLETTSGSATVTVNLTGHLLSVGDRVIISGISGAVEGIPATELNAEHTVVTVPTANEFTITVTTQATGTNATAGGASVRVRTIVSPGSGNSSGGSGWGSGPYSRGGYGTPYSDDTLASLRVWSMDAYGEDLFFCLRDGEVFYWDVSLGTTERPVLLETLGADLPTIAKCVLTSSIERRAFAFGCNPTGSSVQDPLLVRWSTSEDITDWTPTLVNSAGEFRLSSGTQIITAHKSRQEYLIWTEASVFSMQSIGVPEFYGFQPLAENISIVSPTAVAVTGSGVFWMGVDKFYAYSGAVSSLPCAVHRYVFNDVNLTQAFQFFAGTNEGFNEVIWFYCSADALEIDKYVIFNYIDNVWYYGTLSRTAWIDSSLNGVPLGSGSDGLIYQHETGVNDGSTVPPSAIDAYIESAPFELGEGDRYMFVRRVVPDVSFDGSTADSPAVTMTLTSKHGPGSNTNDTAPLSVTRTATSPVTQYTNEVWVRLRGRQATFKIESNAVGVKWQLGTPRVDTQPDGRRA